MKSNPESTQPYSISDRASAWLERTMPKTPEGAAWRRRIALGATAASTAVVSLVAMNSLHSNNSQPHESFNPTAAATFEGDTSITSIQLNPQENLSVKIRSSPEAGLRGITNLIGEISDKISIDTPQGVNITCPEGDVYRQDITGETMQRCWIEVPASDLVSSLDARRLSEKYPELIETMGSLASGEFFVANDLVSVKHKQ